MAKFGRRRVSLHLSVPALDAPRRALRSLFQRADTQDALNLSGLAISENSPLRNAVLRAEYQKTLGFQYLEKRKLTLI